ncbi:TPA: hypothetical protein ACGO2Q_001148 [Streptococcus suis]
MKNIEQRLDEIEDLVISMNEVSVTIPWGVAKDLLSRAGHLTSSERRLLQWHFGDAPHCSKRSEKVRLLLESLGNG